MACLSVSHLQASQRRLSTLNIRSVLMDYLLNLGIKSVLSHLPTVIFYQLQLDGLNSGVPTRTTATLTPTTLRSVEQFLEIPSQVEAHQNQARFVPPVIHPTHQGMFFSVHISNWHKSITL